MNIKYFIYLSNVGEKSQNHEQMINLSEFEQVGFLQKFDHVTLKEIIDLIHVFA